MNGWWLLPLGVVAGLAGYAAYLWTQVWLHQQRQRRVTRARNAELCVSIRTIAWAAEQQQCELAEAAVRLCVLLDLLVVDALPAFADRFPALHGLFAAIRDQPTHEARQQLSRSERQRLDRELQQAERQWQEQVAPELTALRHFALEQL